MMRLLFCFRKTIYWTCSLSRTSVRDWKGAEGKRSSLRSLSLSKGRNYCGRSASGALESPTGACDGNALIKFIVLWNPEQSVFVICLFKISLELS